MLFRISFILTNDFFLIEILRYNILFLQTSIFIPGQICFQTFKLTEKKYENLFLNLFKASTSLNICG